MKNSVKNFFFVCGLLLTLVASPVFGQQNEKIEINKMPFDAFLLMLGQKVNAEAVVLTKSFSVEFKGVLNKDGNLDAKQSKFTKSTGDAAMGAVGKSFIEAFSESGFFKYLKDFGIDKFDLTLVQDNSQVYAEIISEVETPEKAAKFTSTLNSIIQLLPMLEQTGQKKFSDDEIVFIKGINVRNENKRLMLKFAYEKNIVQEIIESKLKIIGRK